MQCCIIKMQEDEKMPSKQARAFNAVLKQVFSERSWAGGDLETVRKQNASRGVPKLPEGVSLSIKSLGGVNTEIFEKAGNDKGWVFYIHGGGFTVGSARERREITQFIAANCGYNCVSTDYRLAPENRWPAQLDDCYASYKAFAAECSDPGSIILMGESAGGMLALSLALLIKKLAGSDTEEKLPPMPRAIVALSPCVTHAEHFPSHKNNIGTDYILGDMILNGIYEPLFGPDVSEETLKDPIVSPLYADYTGLPPVFVSCTDAETLYDDACELYRRLKEAGHCAGFDMQEGCCHAYQIHPEMMPEAKESLLKAFEFIENTAKQG